jgi:hypothetical protein
MDISDQRPVFDFLHRTCGDNFPMSALKWDIDFDKMIMVDFMYEDVRLSPRYAMKALEKET